MSINEYTNLISAQKSFVSDDVMKLCETLGEAVAKYSEKNNSKTQMRKFYELVQNINRKPNEDLIKVKLRILQAQVAYAVGRKHLGRDIKQLFDVSVEKIVASENLKKELNEFATFFEAFFAYFYYHIEAKKR